MTDHRVAAYIAKYATKGAESAGTADRPIRDTREISGLDVTEHARRMIWTCFALSELAEYADLRLRQWAHMLGYRGHFSTKSRYYSTTLGALRQQRADHRAAQARQARSLPEPADGQIITIKEWHYAGSGHRYGEHFWAENAHERIAPPATSRPASHVPISEASTPEDRARLSAWESDRNMPSEGLNWRECSPMTVADPWSPGLMARQWPGDLGVEAPTYS